MSEKKQNPANARTYFDEDRGCTHNHRCADCGTPVYQPDGVYTVYHGMKFLHNRRDDVMGVLHAFRGLVCNDCWEKGDKEFLEVPEGTVPPGFTK